jgi:hypothetical protein
VTAFVHFGILEEEMDNISGAVVGFKPGAWPDNKLTPHPSSDSVSPLGESIKHPSCKS